MASNCKDAKSESGETQECLAKHRPLLSWECQEQLFRQEVENAEDLRLSIKFFHACLADKKKVIPNHPLLAPPTYLTAALNILEGLRVTVLSFLVAMLTCLNQSILVANMLWIWENCKWRL